MLLRGFEVCYMQVYENRGLYLGYQNPVGWSDTEVSETLTFSFSFFYY